MKSIKLTEGDLVEMVQQIISEKKKKSKKRNLKRKIQLYVLAVLTQQNPSMRFTHQHMLMVMPYKYVKERCPV